jgi:hypothetical protein
MLADVGNVKRDKERESCRQGLCGRHGHLVVYLKAFQYAVQATLPTDAIPKRDPNVTNYLVGVSHKLGRRKTQICLRIVS